MPHASRRTEEPGAKVLADGDVHVWRLGADERAAGDVPDSRLIELLSSDERIRHSRFHFAPDRDRFLRAHAALRLILSRYVGISAADLTFESNEHGRPELVSHNSSGAVRFNLSHTQGAIAIAVCRQHDVGVDVEWHARPLRDLQALADRFFSPPEARALASGASISRAARFFQYWTLKESYIKARGLGLALPLAGFGFTLSPDQETGAAAGAPQIAFAPWLDDDPGAWQFLLTRDASEHTLAVAVRSSGHALRFVMKECALCQLVEGGG